VINVQATRATCSNFPDDILSKHSHDSVGKELMNVCMVCAIISCGREGGTSAEELDSRKVYNSKLNYRVHATEY